MAIIAPFRGLFYNPARVSNLTEVVTPPYDVIRPAERQAFAARHHEGDHQATTEQGAGLEEAAAGRIVGGVHAWPPSLFCPAALWMAARSSSAVAGAGMLISP